MARHSVGLTVTLSIAFVVGLPTARDTSAGGLGVSGDPCGIGGHFGQQSSLPFHLYKAPFAIAPHANRDLEFLWSDTYRQLSKPLVPPGGGENDLDRFGMTLCEHLSNPFGFPQTDIRLVYDYLNARLPIRDSLYAVDPVFPGFLVASQDPTADRNHVDVYIPLPGPDGSFYAQYPPNFTSSAEDSLTPDTTTYWRNALQILGPATTQVGVVGEGGWTRTDTTQNQLFNHEFAHAINCDLQNNNAIWYLHMIASSAEVIGGIARDRPLFDVPYTWNLARSDAAPNYQAWQSFTGYIAYQFRGVDTTSTGRGDDLLWRWARQPQRLLTGLIPRLSDAECAECLAPSKSYLNGLSAIDRFHTLVHNSGPPRRPPARYAIGSSSPAAFTRQRRKLEENLQLERFHTGSGWLRTSPTHSRTSRASHSSYQSHPE